MKVIIDYEVFKKAADLAKGFLDQKEHVYLQTHSTEELKSNAEYNELLDLHATILASFFEAEKQTMISTDVGPAIIGYIANEN